MKDEPLFESWVTPWRWTGWNWFVAVVVWMALRLVERRLLLLLEGWG